MDTEKSSQEDTNTLNDSKDTAQAGSKASAAQSKESKPSVDEIRKRAYEIFQARQGGPECARRLAKGRGVSFRRYAQGRCAQADAAKADGAKAACGQRCADTN